MKSVMFVCAMVLFFLSSCSDEERISAQGVTGEQAVARFKSCFYKGGEVNATKLESHSDTEWAVVTDDNARPCEVFTQITGIEAPLAKAYDYSYTSSDGQCSIRIVGSAEPDGKAVYAVFYVSIPVCPEMHKIYVGTKDYFKGTNEEEYGVPVIL